MIFRKLGLFRHHLNFWSREKCGYNTIFLATVLSLTFSTFLLYSGCSRYSFSFPQLIVYKYETKLPIFKSKVESDSPELKVGSCVFPRTPIFPYFYPTSSWNQSFPYDCGYHKKLVNIIDEKTLIFNPEFFPNGYDSSCCLSEISKGEDDSETKAINCTPIANNSDVSSFEYFSIVSSKLRQIQFEATVNVKNKKKAQKKLEHWAKIPVEDRPLSVLILGFDSISRAQAYRALPKTIAMMKNELGFVDFDSYQSLGPETFRNFLGFLMGLSQDQVRNEGGCAPDWEASLDKCPFLWKEFERENYITSFTEDGQGTFNWGGQGGFENPPTDFYAHPLYLHTEKIRNHQLKLLQIWNNRSAPHQQLNFPRIDFMFSKMYGNCMSNFSIPEFNLNYVNRILRKFPDIPLFTFSWLTHPYHDANWALAYMDNPLLKFFKDLQKETDILDRTLIIFLSDHGDRFYSRIEKSVISYVEVLSPPLFIRIPPKLFKKYPERNFQFSAILKKNSRVFTTPFDLHHTLLHFLHLNKKTKRKDENPDLVLDLDLDPDPFLSATFTNRSSLFSPVHHESSKWRNCQNLNVPPSACLCNVTFDEYVEKTEALSSVSTSNSNSDADADSNSTSSLNENDVFNMKLGKFATDSLNKIINESDYSKFCRPLDIDLDLEVKSVMIQKLSGNPDSGEMEHIVMLRDVTNSIVSFDARIKTFLRKPEQMDKNENGVDADSDSGSDVVMGMELIGFDRTSKYGGEPSCVNKEKTDIDKIMKGLCICRSNDKDKDDDEDS